MRNKKNFALSDDIIYWEVRFWYLLYDLHCFSLVIFLLCIIKQVCDTTPQSSSLSPSTSSVPLRCKETCSSNTLSSFQIWQSKTTVEAEPMLNRAKHTYDTAPPWIFFTSRHWLRLKWTVSCKTWPVLLVPVLKPVGPAKVAFLDDILLIVKDSWTSVWAWVRELLVLGQKVDAAQFVRRCKPSKKHLYLRMGQSWR